MTATSDLEAQIQEATNEIAVRAGNMGILRGEYVHNINVLRESYYPKQAPLEKAVYQNNQWQRILEHEIEWLERKAVKMEQIKGDFFEIRDMSAYKRELFDALKPRFEDALLLLEAVTKQELAILRQYENPPDIVLETIGAVMAVRGEANATWEDAKIVLSESYYYAFFLTKARNQTKQDLSEEARVKLEEFLMKAESEPSRVALVSAPCGAMAKWLTVLRDYYFLQRITTPTKDTLEELRAKLMEKRKTLQRAKDEIADAESKLADLQRDLLAHLRELRDRYDDTLVPLQDAFFEANQKFGIVYSSPERRRLGATLQEAPS